MTDLVTLSQELHDIDLRTGLELSFALRKAARPRNIARSLKSAATRRSQDREMRR